MHRQGLSVLALMMCLGCFEAHGGAGPEGPEAGTPDATARDTGCREGCQMIFDAGIPYDDFEPPPYADLRGTPSDASVARCGTIDGFLRCDECGQEACPPGTLCREHLGVCVGRNDDLVGGCWFTLLPGRLSNGYPATPQPCAVRSSADGSLEARFSGIEMPSSYCVAARMHPDLPPQKCVYPDGTEVVTGIPDEPCPGPEGSMIVCGGSCGLVVCPETVEGKNPCVGFSDTRAFGICAFTERRCAESNAADLLPECGTQLLTWFPEPCACMVVEPQATLPEVGRTGFPVPSEACQRYRSFYPDQVECLDEGWNSL